LATAWWPRLLRRWELVEKITVTMIQLGGWAASARGWEMCKANSKLQAAALQLHCGAAAPSGCILIAVTPRGPGFVDTVRNGKAAHDPQNACKKPAGNHPHDASCIHSPTRGPAPSWTAIVGCGVQRTNRHTTRSVGQHRRVPISNTLQ